MLNSRKKESGFIALISSIIISAVLVAVVFSLSFSGFFTRFNLLDSEYKERSYELAYACFNVAVLRLASDSGYLGNETVTVGADTCQIRTITTPGTIETKAIMSVDGATTNLRGVINLTNFTVTSLIEVPNF